MKQQQQYELLSPLLTDDGRRVTTAEEWNSVRRPQLLQQWTKILGKTRTGLPKIKSGLATSQSRSKSAAGKCEGYTRIELKLPMETDFLQPHVLLIPDNAPWENARRLSRGLPPGRTMPSQKNGGAHGWLSAAAWFSPAGRSFATIVTKPVFKMRSVRKSMSDSDTGFRWEKWFTMLGGKRSSFAVCRKSIPNASASSGFRSVPNPHCTSPHLHRKSRATVSIDPHLALHGDSNYHDPWYLDWKRPFDDIRTDNYPVAELRGTTWSLLDRDPTRPGFEHNHHELLALAAPRALMVIGCSTDKETASHSDDRQSVAYIGGAKEVYKLLNVESRFEYVPLTCGHKATGPEIDAAWQRFFSQWLWGS